MSESPLDGLLRIAEELGRRNFVLQARVHDNGQIAALKEHLETTPRPPGVFPGGFDFSDVPIYYDENIPVGIMRFYFTDNTMQDVRLT